MRKNEKTNFFVVFAGIGFGICVISSYVAMYYNTIISWAVFFLFNSFRRQVRDVTACRCMTLSVTAADDTIVAL